jgi:hypothetical protein
MRGLKFTLKRKGLRDMHTLTRAEEKKLDPKDKNETEM